MIQINERIELNNRRYRRPSRQCDHDRFTFAKFFAKSCQRRIMPELRQVIGARTTCRLFAWLPADAVTVTAGRGDAVSFKTRPMIVLEVLGRREVGPIL